MPKKTKPTVKLPLRDGIILCKGSGFFSKAIKWQTRSDYSHVAINLQGNVYEAKEGKGVLRTTTKAWTYKDPVTFCPLILDPEQIDQMLTFLKAQVGKKYNWSDVFRFVSRKQERRKKAKVWFCSELAFVALLKAYVIPLERCEPWEVSPGGLARTPWLPVDSQIEFLPV